MIKRIVFDIILFLSIAIFPWWLGLALVFVGIFLFTKFYEFIITAIIIYSLYSIPNGNISFSPILFSLIVIIAYLLIQYLRENIALCKNKI